MGESQREKFTKMTTNTLATKIIAASVIVGALKPDKTNTAQNYNYISADKILERAGNALAEAGVIILPSITEETTTQVDYTDSYGKSKSRFDATVRFVMLVTDGETEKELPWYGRGSDFSVPDKALYKAITSGHKYFLMKLLNVGVGNEDGEHENEPSQDGQVAQDSTQKPRQPAQKAQNKPVDGVGEALFDTSKPKISPEQAAIIAHLGQKAYPGENEWADNMDKLAEWASQGARKKLGDLFELEAEKLIKALKKKVEQAA